MKKKTITTIISMITILFIFSSMSYADVYYPLTPDGWVDAHNHYRGRHINTPHVEWDPDLAIKAQKWADTCIWDHSEVGSEYRDYGVGENLGGTVEGWHDEISVYEYDDPPSGINYYKKKNCKRSDFATDEDYERCKRLNRVGHFTQLVWKDTKKIGCGYNSVCGHVVCQYKPAGNDGGKKGFIENVMPLKKMGHNIVWRHSSGNAFVWYMDGAKFQAGKSWAYLGWDSTDWEIVGTADFNNDGDTDILMRNTGNGADSGKNKVWFMNKHIPESKPTPIKSKPGVDWKIVGTGDFDGDGFIDILWRNETLKDTENTVIWLMEGVKYIKQVNLPRVNHAHWKIVGAADFNGDYHSDVLWRNTASGRTIVWYVQKGEYKYYGWLPTANLDWEVGATGDLDDDGITDILLRNTKTGWNAVWYMNGGYLLKKDKPFDWLPPLHPDFKMVGTGSFQ